MPLAVFTWIYLSSFIYFFHSIQIIQRAYQRYSIGTVNYIAKNFLKPSFHESIEKKSHLFSLYGVLCLLRHFGGQVL
jgi:hypothetical protein